MIWNWSFSILLTLLIVKTSYEPSCYTSNRHVLHRRSAFRSWSLKATRDHEYCHRYYLLFCQNNRPWDFKIQVSLTIPQSTLILTWLLSSRSLAFRRTKLVRLSLSRTTILLWRLTFWWDLWTTPLLQFMKAFAQMKLDSEYLSCLRGDQLPPVLNKLAESLSDLKTTMSSLTSWNVAR
jgi:hypothetical protein